MSRILDDASGDVKSAAQTQPESTNAILLAALRAIAGGYWNAGRDKDVTAREYAMQALHDAGFGVKP
jgi:hypothetical protein